jgi:AcrR family transcriptional regulator
MVKKRTAAQAVKLRKTPRQKRSADTVAVIVEAAAHILERDGFEGFNTNAIAEKAGVSIGSLYQYFPSKNALLSALMERETSPLLKVDDELAEVEDWKAALRVYIRASIRYQMRRPRLARLIDIAEKREIFHDQVSSTFARLQAMMEKILKLPSAPRVPNTSVAAEDLLALMRSLIDAAGERGEGESVQLMRRVEGAACGYLGDR